MQVSDPLSASGCQARKQEVVVELGATEALLASAASTKPAAVDEAVAAMVSCGANGGLHGRFFGRLCDIAELSKAQAGPAVNSVLLEQCNPVGARLNG
jgi:hypothetical protein